MAGYSGTPLPKKLGIKPGSTVALLGAPDDFVETLGALPERVEVCHKVRKDAALILLFARSRCSTPAAISGRRQSPCSRGQAMGSLAQESLGDILRPLRADRPRPRSRPRLRSLQNRRHRPNLGPASPLPNGGVGRGLLLVAQRLDRIQPRSARRGVEPGIRLTIREKAIAPPHQPPGH